MYFKKVPHFFSLLFPKAIWSIDTNDFVYLTFDDGPHPSSTPDLLDMLDMLKIKGHFFCLGSNATKYPELVDDIIARGHHLGYHGYHHLSGWATSHIDYINNTKTPTGISFSRSYRPPYGRMTWSQYSTISKENSIIMWDVMPGDFDKNRTETHVLNSLKTCTSAGSIIALHDTQSSWTKNKNILSDYKDFINSQGLNFSLLSDT